MESSREVRHALHIAGLVPHVLHRANNHLAVILGYADLARDSLEGEDRVRFEALSAEARSVAKLLRQLGTFAAGVPGRSESTDLFEALSDVAALIEPAAMAAHHALELDVAQGLPLASVDPVAFLVRVVEAASAALGGPETSRQRLASQGPGRLRLRTRRRRDGLALWLSVSRGDTELPELDPAFLGQKTGRIRRLGTQLASIRMDFEAVGTVDQPTARELEQTKRLLVIESDALLAELLKTVLVESGYHVVVESTLESARRSLALQPFDLVVRDNDLGDDPLEMTIATLWLDSEVRRADSPLRLTKPFRPNALLEAVKLALQASA